MLSHRLSTLDWDFAEKKHLVVPPDVHPYPAKFIPEIPHQLISELGVPKGTSILDPFCGSGTTLAVAQSMGIAAIGIDLNPIACLISRVKTSPLPKNLYRVALEVVEAAIEFKVATVDIPNIPNLDHWFRKDIQKNVMALKTVINGLASLTVRDTFSMCLSSILVRVSNQESDTRYAAIDKLIKSTDVFKFFLAVVKKLEDSRVDEKSNLPKVSVINKDVLSVTRKDVKARIGLVVTSPPYPNAYEYWLYHKYRMFWLDFDPISVKEREIGARAHFFKKNHHTEKNFLDQMTGTFRLISDVLVDGGHAAFVVGRSKIHGKIVDNADIVQRAATANGLTYVCTLSRAMNSQRKSFNLSHANIKQEQIVVVKK